MSRGPLKVILPNAIIGLLLLAGVVAGLVDHHRSVAFVMLGLDAINLVMLRVLLFRWVKRNRR